MIIIRVESQPCALSAACGHVFVETPNVVKGFYPNEWVGPLAWEQQVHIPRVIQVIILIARGGGGRRFTFGSQEKAFCQCKRFL